VLLAGLTPVVLAILGMCANLFYQHYTFMAGFLSAEHRTQKDEIAIFRISDDPKHPMVTTGWFFDDLRGHDEKKEIRDRFNLGFWEHDWKPIVVKLEPIKSGLALYRLGNVQPALDTLVAALKDEDYDVRTQAVAALGNLLKPKLDTELLALLANNLSGYRAAGAQALARQDSLPAALLKKIDQLRQDDRPWVCLAAWEAYDLMQARLKSEAEARKLLQQADSVFASGQYEDAWEILKGIIRVDSAKTAYAKFQQARCEAKLERNAASLEALEIALQYQKTLRDTLQAEMAQPNNDWAILQGNWYGSVKSSMKTRGDF